MLPVADVDQIIADPLFEAPSNEDFRIPSTSPAVGAGLILAEPISDFDQISFQEPPSIGAFEGGEISTPIDQIQNEFTHIFPNPFSKSIHIDGQFTNINIRLINHLGQMIQNYSNVNLPVILDFNYLPNGMYFILLESLLHDQLILKKVVKKDGH